MSRTGKFAMIALAWALAGCATTGANPADPLEPLNRAMFRFNDTVDTAVVKPVAQGYRAVVPGLVRTGVSNFFSNLEDVWIGANNFMQGKVEQGLGDFLRFTFNSSFGLFGLIDVASDMGLAKHNEDFGQTLGVWGIGAGPYLVLPFLGPSTLRDGVAWLADTRTDAVVNLDKVPARNTLYVTRLESTRARLLDTTGVIEEAAMDKYAYVRSAWLQRRRSLVYDGNPPRERDESGDDDTPPAEKKSGMQ